MIDRKALTSRHNPVLYKADTESALTVGNGSFAFTADITGTQSLYDDYLKAYAPLCTMSQWGWHTAPASNGRGLYTLDNVQPTLYDIGGRHYEYAVERKPGSEHIYDWLRHNPHRLNLARIYLSWDGKPLAAQSLSNTRQELDLYTGVLHSDFELSGKKITVKTAAMHSADAVGFSITAPECDHELAAVISFPYGSHLMSASDWDSRDRHTTRELENSGGLVLLRALDGDGYRVRIDGTRPPGRTGEHEYTLQISNGRLDFTVWFEPESRQKRSALRKLTFSELLSDSVRGWERFWQDGGAADFSGSTDPRAHELERRAVLSQYLTAVHCAGKLPPQETGLSCNSWYGKFHLEMHILHSGWFPLWGRSEMLERSFGWYLGILDNAKKNAARNGFKGARWPKMTGPEGIDCPSPIATLLIWQQPHLLYMLELARLSKPGEQRAEFMEVYWEAVRQTADFMCSFTRNDTASGEYCLPPPLIPAQEEHAPEAALDPVFELSYWRFGLELAVGWAGALGRDCSVWERVLAGLPSSPPAVNGLYPAHRNCPDTFTNFNRDHPSMLFAYGFIPCSGVDTGVMSATVDKVMSCWDFGTSWGWDFALMAMTLTRLGRPGDAVDALLMDAPKNSYTSGGNNYQRGRNDLPLYLPGNGSLLLALAMMLAGYGSERGMKGFPDDGTWSVRFEGISPLPY